MFNMGASNGGCGIWETYGTGTFSGNEISDNTVSDACCGVGYVPPDIVSSGSYFNVLYTVLVNTPYPFRERGAITGPPDGNSLLRGRKSKAVAE